MNDDVNELVEQLRMMAPYKGAILTKAASALEALSRDRAALAGGE